MTTLGFEDYVEPLKVYLQKFREAEGQKDTSNKQSAAAASTAAADTQAAGGSGDGSNANA